MNGFEVCNLTVQTALDRFPSLRGCVCACQEDLCASTPAVVTQCRRQAGAVLSSLSEKHLQLRLHFLFTKGELVFPVLPVLMPVGFGENVHPVIFSQQPDRRGARCRAGSQAV